MGFYLDDLISTIISSETLSLNEKNEFLKLLINGNLNRGIFIHEGFYLKNSQNNEGMIQCNYRNVDPSGQTMHGNTNWTDSNMVIEVYLDSLRKNKAK